jgi:hypothetical protein
MTTYGNIAELQDVNITPESFVFHSKHRKVALMADPNDARDKLLRRAVLPHPYAGLEGYGVCVGHNALLADGKA